MGLFIGDIDAVVCISGDTVDSPFGSVLTGWAFRTVLMFFESPST